MAKMASVGLTSNVNLPSMSVDAPLLVPFIAIVAPGKVSFVSAAVISPVIGLDCAND